MTVRNEPASESKLVEYLRWVTADLVETRQRLSDVESSATEPIAVVGMSCRYPGGANTVDLYWQKLLDGLDAVREVPPDRWDAAEVYDADRAAPGKAYTQHAGFLDDVTGWDAGFFGLPPQEVRRLDPQHRLLLELVWEGLEDAGLAADRLRGSRTGVYIGLIDAQWSDRQADIDGRDLVNDPYVALGSAQGAAAGRIAYQFDLRGPTMTVDTACSSSLVATHLAVQGLRRGECDIALVGASSVLMHPNTFIAGCKMGMLASDGRSKAFDASGDGYGLGEGGGLVVLQRAADATASGRRVHALIRGSAVNQDGRSNGLTAPNRQAQVALLRTALRGAGLGPNDLDFLEAHGTGTALGDAIEFGALLDVFGDRVAEHPLLVGAVKANIGHLHAASGLAGLIKSVLAVKHGEVPRNLHMTNPISVVTPDGPVRPVRDRTPLPSQEQRPRRAGVSSFGWSGTNAHVVVEQAPEAQSPRERGEGPTARLVTVSAETESGLARAATALADHLASAGTADLADVAYTTQTGRSGLRFRRAISCADMADAVARLRLADGTPLAPVPMTEPVVGMLFPGTAGALDDSVTRHPAFRAAVDECAALLAEDGVDPHAVLGESGPAHEHLRAFLHGYALFTLSRSLGVVPALVSGESAGEEVADHVAGRYGLAEALALVRCRDTGRDPTEALAAIEWHEPRLTVVPTLAGLVDQADVVVAAGPLPAGLPAERAVQPLDPDQAPGQAWGRLWELGVPVDWAAAWPAPGRMVDLPTYPFERTPFWPELPSGARTPARDRSAPPRDSARGIRCHTPTWHRDDALPPATPVAPATLLVLGDHTGLGAEVARVAAAAGHRVLRVEPGGGYARTGETTFTIAATDPEDYPRLLREVAGLAGERTEPLRVVHAFAASADADNPDTALDAGFYSLLWLAKAVGRELADRPVELVAVTADVFDVLGGDGHHPVSATVSGVCQVIDQEYPGIRCHCVDLADPAGAATTAATQVLREVELLAGGAAGGLVAWRRGRRWLRTFAEVALPAADQELVWRPGGSYIVIGGLSGLGLLLATRLAPLGVRLTLVGRTELPEEADWDAWLAEHGQDDEVSARLLAVRALRAGGAEVLPLQADITEAGQAERVVRTARERFGTLHGVVHTAGAPSGSDLRLTTRRQAAAVFAPKVHGTLAIAEALRDDPPELLVLYSSSVAALGWRGAGDQAAANAFLDAFAASDVEKVARRVVSVAWGPWRRGTRQSEEPDPFLEEHLERYREEFGITDDEGTGVLPRIVAAGPAHVVVLTQPFAELAERVSAIGGAGVGPHAPQAGPKYPRPDLRTPYVAPRTTTERRVAQVWQDYLGIEEVGVHDSFFDIGGTSMVAASVVNAIGRDFGVAPGPGSLFDRPTVAEFAALLAELDPSNDTVTDSPAADTAPRVGRRRDRR